MYADYQKLGNMKTDKKARFVCSFALFSTMFSVSLITYKHKERIGKIYLANIQVEFG